MDHTFPESTHVPDSALSDKAGQARVRAVLRALSKFINGKKIYTKNNPILVKFAADLNRTLQAVFETHDTLVLTIEQQRILWGDTVVYEEEKRDESIAFILYKDGVGEITMQRDITFDELESFTDLLKSEIHNYSPDEDIVTKLWRAEFENISYRVLDDYLTGQYGEGRREDGDETPIDTRDHPDLPSFADKGRIIVAGDERAPVTRFSHYVRSLSDQTYLPNSRLTEEEHLQSTLRSFFTVSSEELKMLQEEREAERETDSLASFLEAILDFTLLPENPSAVRDILNVVERTVEFVLAEARLKSLRDTLELIRRFRSSHEVPDNVVVLFDRVEAQLSDTSFLLSLGRRVEHWAEEAEDLFAYYRTVGKRAIPTLCSLLGDLKAHNLHLLACDTLIAIEPDDMSAVIDRLDIDDPRTALDAVYLISHTSKRAIPRVVKQLMYYPDNRVREQVIKYLAKNRRPDALVLLVELLDDAEKNIRLKALSAAEEIDDPIVANKIRSMALEKDVGNRGMDEQEYIYRALGKVEGAGALPYLRQMLEKRSFFGFGRTQNKTEKLLAVRALEQVANEEAVHILAGLAEDENNLVRLKAQRALRNIEASTDDDSYSDEGSDA